MKTTIRFLCSFSLLASLAAFGSIEVQKVSVADLLDAPATFDGKDVRATAVVEGFQQKTSRRGNKYFTFKLKDGEKAVNVFSQGTSDPELKAGMKVEVTGVFRKEKKVGDIVFKNEIEATKQDGKPYGVKPIK
jgi:hypothetical protein